jgi:hypothetical protein
MDTHCVMSELYKIGRAVNKGGKGRENSQAMQFYIMSIKTTLLELISFVISERTNLFLYNWT